MHSFKDAKEVYLWGIQELMDVKKLTADDPAFNEKIKQWIKIMLDWAESCK